MSDISKAMRACLTYYGDNEHNPDRRAYPPYEFNMRQVNRALDLDYLRVGPGGWHILSEAGRSALSQGSQPMTLSDLITALERAEGPSRELDEAIALTVLGMRKENRLAAHPDCDPIWDFYDGNSSGSMEVMVDRFTASIDAAVALCEQVLPGWAWTLGKCWLSDDAWVSPDFNSPTHGSRLKAELLDGKEVEAGSQWDAGFDVDQRPTKSVALALCLAILKAKQAMEHHA